MNTQPKSYHIGAWILWAYSLIFIIGLVCVVPIVFFYNSSILFDEDLGGLWLVAFLVVYCLTPIYLITYLIAAYGLSKEKKWGRTAGFIAAILSLFNFPFGTITGIVLFVLFLRSPQGKPVVEENQPKITAEM